MRIQEKRLEFEIAGKRIAAAYSEPAEAPAEWCIVLIAGSGPSDIDGNYPEGGMWPGRTNILRDLANQFASRGVACFRYSRANMVTFNEEEAAAFKRFDHRAEVAAAACRCARELAPRSARLAAAGHSEGSVVASMLCTDHPEADVRAMISLSGPAYRFYDLMLLGAERRSINGVMHMGPMSIPLELYRKGVESARYGTPPPPELDALPFGFHKMDADAQSYLRGYDAVDNFERIGRVACPVMIVQGDADMSVWLENGERLVKARQTGRLPVEKAFFAGLDHFYKKAGSDTADETVAEVIAAWLKSI